LILVFTDLDGTLLDFETYSFKGAEESIRILKRRKIPIIIVTSKTRYEVKSVREKLGIKDPFIVENGGGVYFDKNYWKNFEVPDCKPMNGLCVVKFGKDYKEVRKFFSKLKEMFPVVGFGDMSVEEIMELTGLNREDARNAKNREFSEPFIVPRSLISEVREEAIRNGFNVVEGGRFFHLVSATQGKGKAVKFVESVFSKFLGGKTISIGLGDSPNDEDMLRSVDIPIQIPHPGKNFKRLKVENLRIAEFPGSRGWNQSIKEVLSEIKGDC